MASALDDLVDLPGPVGDVERDTLDNPPLPTETPSDQASRVMQQDQQAARIQRTTAAQLASRDIPTYTDDSGNVQPIRDESGTALTSLDRKNGVAYDSQGRATTWGFDETGAPKLSRPLEAPPNTVDKQGNLYTVAPGLPWQWQGTDPAQEAQAKQDAADAAAKAFQAANGRQMTANEKQAAQLKAAQGEHIKALAPFMAAVPPEQAGDPDGQKKAINDHFDEQTGAITPGFWSGTLTDDQVQQKQALEGQRQQFLGRVDALQATTAARKALTAKIQQEQAVQAQIAGEQAQRAQANLAQLRPDLFPNGSPQANDAISQANPQQNGANAQDSGANAILSPSENQTNAPQVPRGTIVPQNGNPLPVAPPPGPDNGVGGVSHFFGTLGDDLYRGGAAIDEGVARVIGSIPGPWGDMAKGMAADLQQRRQQYAELESGQYSKDNPLAPGGREVGSNPVSAANVNPALKDTASSGIAHGVAELPYIAAGLPAFVLKAASDNAAEAGDKGENRLAAAGEGAVKAYAMGKLFEYGSTVAEKLIPATVIDPARRFIMATAIGGGINSAIDAVISKLQGGNAIPQTWSEFAQRGLMDFGFGVKHGWDQLSLPKRVELAQAQQQVNSHIFDMMGDAGIPVTDPRYEGLQRSSAENAAFLKQHAGILESVNANLAKNPDGIPAISKDDIFGQLKAHGFTDDEISKVKDLAHAPDEPPTQPTPDENDKQPNANGGRGGESTAAPADEGAPPDANAPPQGQPRENANDGQQGAPEAEGATEGNEPARPTRNGQPPEEPPATGATAPRPTGPGGDGRGRELLAERSQREAELAQETRPVHQTALRNRIAEIDAMAQQQAAPESPVDQAAHEAAESAGNSYAQLSRQLESRENTRKTDADRTAIQKQKQDFRKNISEGDQIHVSKESPQPDGSKKTEIRKYTVHSDGGRLVAEDRNGQGGGLEPDSGNHFFNVLNANTEGGEVVPKTVKVIKPESTLAKPVETGKTETHEQPVASVETDSRQHLAEQSHEGQDERANPPKGEPGSGGLAGAGKSSAGGGGEAADRGEVTPEHFRREYESARGEHAATTERTGIRFDYQEGDGSGSGFLVNATGDVVVNEKAAVRNANKIRERGGDPKEWIHRATDEEVSHALLKGIVRSPNEAGKMLWDSIDKDTQAMVRRVYTGPKSDWQLGTEYFRMLDQVRRTSMLDKVRRTSRITEDTYGDWPTKDLKSELSKPQPENAEELLKELDAWRNEGKSKKLDAEQEMAANEHRESIQQEAGAHNQQGHELLDALRSVGGLPSAESDPSLSGELARVEDAVGAAMKARNAMDFNGISEKAYLMEHPEGKFMRTASSSVARKAAEAGYGVRWKGPKAEEFDRPPEVAEQEVPKPTNKPDEPEQMSLFAGESPDVRTNQEKMDEGWRRAIANLQEHTAGLDHIKPEITAPTDEERELAENHDEENPDTWGKHATPEVKAAWPLEQETGGDPVKADPSEWPDSQPETKRAVELSEIAEDISHWERDENPDVYTPPDEWPLPPEQKKRAGELYDAIVHAHDSAEEGEDGEMEAPVISPIALAEFDGLRKAAIKSAGDEVKTLRKTLNDRIKSGHDVIESAHEKAQGEADEISQRQEEHEAEQEAIQHRRHLLSLRDKPYRSALHDDQFYDAAMKDKELNPWDWEDGSMEAGRVPKEQLERKNDMLAQGAWLSKIARKKDVKVEDLVDEMKEWRDTYPDAKSASKAFPIPRAFLEGGRSADDAKPPTANELARNSEKPISGRTGAEGSFEQSQAEFRDSVKPLVDWAKANGRIFSPKLAKLVGPVGSEHDVIMTPGRVLKVTNPDAAGNTPVWDEAKGQPKFVPANADDYARRLELNQHYLDDSQRIEGVMNRGDGAVSIVTSQDHIGKLRKPSQPQINQAMREAGFHKLAFDDEWYHPGENLAVFDAHPDNFFMDGDQPRPLDVVSIQPEGKFKDWAIKTAESADDRQAAMDKYAPPQESEEPENQLPSDFEEKMAAGEAPNEVNRLRRAFDRGIDPETGKPLKTLKQKAELRDALVAATKRAAENPAQSDESTLRSVVKRVVNSGSKTSQGEKAPSGSASLYEVRNELSKLGWDRARQDKVIEHLVRTKWSEGGIGARQSDDSLSLNSRDHSDAINIGGSPRHFLVLPEGMGAGEAPERDVTSIKNAQVDREREARGLPPAMQAARRSFGTVWDEAMRRIDRDPTAPERLVNELIAKPRAISDLEDAMLLHRQITLQSDHANATKELQASREDGDTARRGEAGLREAHVWDQLLEHYDANKAAGTETARGLNARKMLAHEDYSLARMVDRARAAVGGRKLTADEQAQVKQRFAEIEKRTKDLDARQAELEKQAAEIAEREGVQRAKDEAAAKEDPEIANLRKIAQMVHDKGRSAVERFKARYAAKSESMAAGEAPKVDPEDMKDFVAAGTEHALGSSDDFEAWSSKMRADFGDAIEPHLKEVFKSAKDGLEQVVGGKGPKMAAKLKVARPTIEKMRDRVADGADLRKLKPYLAALARELVSKGVTEGARITDALHDAVKTILPEATRSDVRAAWLGYGDYTEPSKEAIEKQYQQLRIQEREKAKQEDILKGKVPALSGRGMPVPEDEARREIAKTQEMLKKSGLRAVDPERQAKTALDSIKTRIKNQIADLTHQIETGVKPEVKPGVPYDYTAERLADIRDRLRKTLEEIEGKPEMSDEDRVKVTMKALQKSIADYSDRLLRNDYSLKEGRKPMSTPEIEAMRARRNSIRDEWMELRQLDEDFQRQKQATRATELQKSIADIDEQLRTGKFKQGKGAQPESDPEIEALKSQRDAMNRELAAQKQALDPKRHPSEVERRKLEALQKSIDDLDGKIKEGDLSTKARKESTDSAAAESLKNERAAMQRKITEMRREAAKLPPDEAAAKAEARKIEAVQKQIDALDAKLKSGDLSTKGKTGQPMSTTREALVSERQALAKELAEQRKKANAPTQAELDARKAAGALKAWKTNATRRMADLKDQIARNEFTPKKRQSGLKLDAEGQKMKAALDATKLDWERKMTKWRNDSRPAAIKALDGVAKWSRAFVLSGPTAIAKLSSAAGEIMGFAPLESAIGEGLRHIPGVSDVAKLAPRHGSGFNAKAEAKAVFETLRRFTGDFGSEIKTGQMDIDRDYGGKKAQIMAPPELKDYIAHVHGALKSSARRNEFTRSLELRLTAAAQNGEDITDPLVQTKHATQAYVDAQKAIFSHDNVAVQAYNHMLSWLGKPDKDGNVSTGAKALQTAAKVMFPVVKIPVNIASRVVEYSVGSAMGAAKLAGHAIEGAKDLNGAEKLNFAKAVRTSFEKMPAAQREAAAEALMANLKRGSLGLAMMSLGYFMPQTFGGYYQKNEKRGENEAQAGGARIGGVNIPRFLLHNPLLEQLQIGATIRRVADAKLSKKSQQTRGTMEGILAAVTGVASEIPFVRETADVSKLTDAHNRGDVLANLAAQKIVPQGVQAAAKSETVGKLSDKLVPPSGGVPTATKREPHGLLQETANLVPFWRRTVPVAKPKAAGRAKSTFESSYQ